MADKSDLKHPPRPTTPVGEGTPTDKPGAERRKHPRLSLTVEVDFRSEHNFYSAKTQDISVGGLFIETQADLPIGAKLIVDLSLMKRRLSIEAEVVWALLDDARETAGLGVRFVDLKPDARKTIEAFMALRKPIGFGMVED